MSSFAIIVHFHIFKFCLKPLDAAAALAFCAACYSLVVIFSF